ncbi:prephenate dehydratase [Streptomyces harbinensis]|uniref:prephenate dehydratase n=1 Tax=Streptomyces harbinensis TaxID=1176198 RepID=UPI0034DF25BC
MTAASRYTYLGPEGTFTEAALRTLPEAATRELVPMISVPAALDAVRAGDAAGALVPIENSVEGGVSATVDELASGEPLMIYREVLLPIAFALLVRPGTTLADIKTVTGHPVAQPQVRGWLAQHLPQAQWESVLTGRPARPAAPTGADKTSVVLWLRDDHPGALLEVLQEFATCGVNLMRIESRPTGAGIGQYSFSLDCEGHISERRVGEALMGLRRLCRDIRFLGSYPRADRVAATVREGTTDPDFLRAADWLTRCLDGRGA